MKKTCCFTPNLAHLPTILWDISWSRIAIFVFIFIWNLWNAWLIWSRYLALNQWMKNWMLLGLSGNYCFFVFCFFREVKFCLVSVCHTSIHPSIMQKATKNNHDDILHDLLFVMICIESHLRHIRIFSWFYEKLLFLWNKSTWDCIRLWAKKFQSCHHLAKQTNLYSKTASDSI